MRLAACCFRLFLSLQRNEQFCDFDVPPFGIDWEHLALTTRIGDLR